MNLPSAKDFKLFFDDPLWQDVARSILARHRINFERLVRAEHGENIVFLVDSSLVLKIYTPLKKGFERERAALGYIAGKTDFAVPQIIVDGEIEGFDYLVMTQLEGRLMLKEEWLETGNKDQARLVTQLASGLSQLHDVNSQTFDFDWAAFLRTQKETAFSKQQNDSGNPEWIASLPAVLDNYLPLIPEKAQAVFQHGDVHFGNIRVSGSGSELRISGMFDFADSLKGFREYEFVAIGVLMIQGQGHLQREFFRAYGYAEHEIDASLRRRMMALTLLYEHSSLRRYAERLRPEAVGYTLAELERAIWSFV